MPVPVKENRTYFNRLIQVLCADFLAQGGVPVRNVAQAVIKKAFALYELEPARRDASETLLESGALEQG